MSPQLIEDLSLSLMQRLLNDSCSVRIITSKFDSDTHLPFGSGVTLLSFACSENYCDRYA